MIGSRPGTMRTARIRFLLPLLLLVAVPGLAQGDNARVRDLNRQAIDAYHQLDIDRANALLGEARQACGSSPCTAAERARTLANLGIVAFGGAGDSSRALDYFREALTIDPTLRLDPMLTTPDIELLYQRARTEAAQANVAGAGGVQLRHTPPGEQLVHTPLPLYVETPPDVNVRRMDLRYLGNGMRRYATLPMQVMVDGFGVELACEHVFEPGLSYYFIAYDSQGHVIRTVGTEQQPFRVPVVDARTMQAPALPGRAPPATCTLDECPPDMDCSPGARGAASASRGAGASCSATSACDSGFVCRDGTCEASSSSDDDEDGPYMRYYVELGTALTMANGRQGMTAADRPPLAPGELDPQLDADPFNDSYVRGGTHGCDLPANEYCVRVTTNGRTWAWGLQLNAGVWVTERIGLGATVRIAPQAGSGTLSHVQIGVRAQYRFLVPRPTGLHASAHLGLGMGQIQVRPRQEATAGASSVLRPWAETGLIGAHLGGTIGYRFAEKVGFFATPEFFVLFPNTALGGNFIAGIDFAFGAVGGSREPEPEQAPPPPPDTDRDGIADPDDRCPAEAEDRDSFQDDDGCPDRDDDMDGIADVDDGCRTEPEDADGFQDADGCPDPDNDGDTVLDYQDQCPLEAGPMESRGCPDPDRDLDTVPDRIDNCPDEAGVPENRGCRVQQLVVIEGDRLEILEKVYFRTNSHVIDRRSFLLLNQVAAVINAHPEIVRVNIEGHTDARGNAARNRTLSQRRANSVRDYLSRQGVALERLSATGFGPDRPVFATATTDEEHEANRRVEFRLEMR